MGTSVRYRNAIKEFLVAFLDNTFICLLFERPAGYLKTIESKFDLQYTIDGK